MYHSCEFYRVPLIVSVNRLGSAKIVDISLAEEACTHSALWVAVAPPADVQNNVSQVSKLHNLKNSFFHKTP